MGGNESTSKRCSNADGTENDDHSLKTEISDYEMAKAGLAAAGVVVAGVVLLASVVGDLASSSEDSRKTMKAPGRNDRIFRDDFEKDPKTYFRDLRKGG